MRNIVKNDKKKILAMQIAISFFFTAIFIVIFFLVFEKKVSYFSSIINTTVVERKVSDKVTAFDSVKKRLINYPTYGSKYGVIKIPSINRELSLYYGDNLKILRYGVGHYAGSYFPGEGGSIVLAAHNNPGYFDVLPKIKKGDKITIEASYGTFVYEVDNYKVVKETDLDAFPVQDEKELLILYTCYPIDPSIVGRRTQRFVVYAYREDER